MTWLPTAVPAAVRLVKREGIDAVITTSPPNSMNLIGAAVKRLTGIPWVADLRDSVVGNADVRFDSRAVQAKEKALQQVVAADRALGRRGRLRLGADRRRGARLRPGRARCA